MPKYKQWSLILWDAEGSWYLAAVVSAGECVLNLALANAVGSIGFDPARDTPSFCWLCQL